MKQLDVEIQWTLYHFPQDSHTISNPSQLAEIPVKPVPATVPGNVELDLVKSGEIGADPFTADTVWTLRKYELYEWWYVGVFTIHEQPTCDTIELRFRGVDCLATYWLNDTQIGASDNMFIEHSFQVGSLLNIPGTNTIAVRLGSAFIDGASRQYDPVLTTCAHEAALEHLWIRKASHGYGWDIMPRILSAGLWRPVEIWTHDTVEITALYLHAVSVETQLARIGIHYELKVPPSLLWDLELRLSAVCGTAKFTARERVLSVAGHFFMDVENPVLWWPVGYGEAAMYDVSIQIVHGEKILAEKKTRTGLRTVELIRTETTSRENPGEFLIKINNTPILCKGTNWVPADAFHSRDAQRYTSILSLAEECGCNIIRCWGGNVYEDHAFFEFCDDHGIMVWQDFAMACAYYPQQKEFVEKIRSEAAAVVRKLREHPSLIVWCGDNEADQFLMNFDIDPGTNRITREVLPDIVRQCDPWRPYLPSSPYYSPEAVAKKNVQLLPERHLWGPRDYYKTPFYEETNAHFVSEIGYHGCTNLSSIRRFIDSDRLWPWNDNEQWIAHATSATGIHGRHVYRLRLMANQIRELFGFEPQTIEDFILASQICQAEAKKFFIESTRLKKWRRTGIIWWNLIDGWPQFSDAVVDYYFGKKLAFHYISRVQKPVCIMIDEPAQWHVQVVAGNDSREPVYGRYRVWDADTEETMLEGNYRVPANENISLGRISISRSDKRLFLIQWDAHGKEYGNHYLLGTPPFSLEIYRGWLKKIAHLCNDFSAENTGA